MYIICTMVRQGNVLDFEWDEGNVDKSYRRHRITPSETEEIFLDEKLKVIKDIEHSQKEKRFIALGKTFTRKILFAVFTVRSKKIRIISARIANKKERRKYEKT